MTKPARNILLIMTDDMNTALSCYGHPAVHTPNFDRLARMSTRFSQAFCPYPLCGPSRAAVLTGQRPEVYPMPINEVAWRDIRPDLRTLPEIARAQGLHSERIGKIFHHGISKNNPVDPAAEAEDFLPPIQTHKVLIKNGVGPPVFMRSMRKALKNLFMVNHTMARHCIRFA